MQLRPFCISTMVSVALGAVLAPAALSQQQTPTPSNQPDEVIRIASELVQTDVTVVDRKGALVGGLTREQFDLRIDKKSRPILFFESVRAGSANEEAQLAAARGGSANQASPSKGTAVPLDRGRTIFFYFDDFHLSPDSMNHARKMLVRFIERDMGQNDEVAIASASGQVGFLQQLSDNKTVLRLAIERLRARPFSMRDGERPPMSESHALLIENNDPGVLGYFVEALIKEVPGISNPEEWVRGRARRILEQANYATSNTLVTLASLIASSKDLPGRKLMFFVSDGFSIDTRREAFSKLRQVTGQAARAGVVIYSIDARGLIASLTDASSPVAADYTGRLAKAEIGQISASQDALNALARDTGGRPLFDTNDLSIGVTRALKETSAYYLIAWHPETEEQRAGKFNKIEVSIVGHPELVVRLRRTFAEKETLAPIAKNQPQLSNVPPAKQVENELRGAIKTTYPAQGIPTALSLKFLDAPEVGPTVAATMQVTLSPQSFTGNENQPVANIDLGGVVYDTAGKVAGTFQTRMTVKGTSPEPNSSLPDNLAYNHLFRLKPGLYQIRVAARDAKDGRVGSARQWIEIPDLSSRKLVLSSLILAKRTTNGTELVSQAKGVVPASLSIDHHFERSANLRFVAFVYNAARGVSGSVFPVDSSAGSTTTLGAGPDVAIQVQVLRDNQPVITTPLRRIEIHAETDMARVPYAAELPLSDLLAGRYLLQVTVIDRIAKTSATQYASFAID
jgi:VWFA-related protein